VEGLAESRVGEAFGGCIVIRWRLAEGGQGGEGQGQYEETMVHWII